MNGYDHDSTYATAEAERDSRIAALGDGPVLRGRVDRSYIKSRARRAATVLKDLPFLASRVEIAGLCETPRPHGLGRGEPAAGPPNRLVLLTTGDERLRSAGREFLSEQGYLVVTASGGVGCVALLRRLVPDVVILDTDLLWGGAEGVLAHLRAGDELQVPVVLLVTPVEAANGSMTHDATLIAAVLEKPVGPGELLSAVRSAAGAGTVAYPEE
jgi:CheY-like chemotaxis protein